MYMFCANSFKCLKMSVDFLQDMTFNHPLTIISIPCVSFSINITLYWVLDYTLKVGGVKQPPKYLDF